MSERNHKSSMNKAAGAMALSLVLNLSVQSMANAGPTNEVFNARVNTAHTSNEIFNAVPQNSGATSAPRAFTPAPANPVAAPGAMDMAGAGGTPEVRWFETLDGIIFSGYPKSNEKNVLSRPFNQEAERVEQWIIVAQAVSKRYHDTAKALRQLPVPANWTEMAEYRDARSDWFDEAAGIYEDLYRPRKPAHTIEELTAQLDDVKSRADQLAVTKQNNREWDRKLRVHYHVHAPKETDALTIYVSGKAH
jgi:hypothetical protein